MLKMMPPKPKTYMTVTAAMWKRERTVIVDPSGGIPSVSIIIIEIQNKIRVVRTYQATLWIRFLLLSSTCTSKLNLPHPH